MSNDSESTKDELKAPPLIFFMAPVVIVVMLAAAISSIAIIVDPTLADIDVCLEISFEAQLESTVSVGALIINDSKSEHVIVLRDHLDYFMDTYNSVIILNQTSTEWCSYSVDITKEFGTKRIGSLGIIALDESRNPSPFRLDSIEFSEKPFDEELESFNADDGINLFDRAVDENSSATIVERLVGSGSCFQVAGFVDTNGDSHDFVDLEVENPEKVSVTPIKEEEGSEAQTALLNAVIYVLIVLLGGFFILFLIKSGLANVMQAIFAFLIGLACISFGYYFIAVTFWFFLYHLQFVFRDVAEFLAGDDVFFSIVLLGTLIYTVLSFLGIGMERIGWRVRNALLISFGAGLGAFLGLHFPLWSTLLVLIALAVYDIYAVFYGPIRGILEESDKQAQIVYRTYSEQYHQANGQNIFEADEKEQYVYDKFEQPIDEPSAAPQVRFASHSLIPGLPVYQSASITIGLGDFAFYSLLVAHSSLYGVVPLLLTTLGVLGGAYLTFSFLERKKALPGLPISIFLGIAGFLIGIFFFRTQ